MLRAAVIAMPIGCPRLSQVPGFENLNAPPELHAGIVRGFRRPDCLSTSRGKTWTTTPPSGHGTTVAGERLATDKRHPGYTAREVLPPTPLPSRPWEGEARGRRTVVSRPVP